MAWRDRFKWKALTVRDRLCLAALVVFCVLFVANKRSHHVPAPEEIAADCQQQHPSNYNGSKDKCVYQATVAAVLRQQQERESQ